MTKLITLEKKDVCRNWLDFHSVGHFVMGMIIYITIYFVCSGLGLIPSLIIVISLMMTFLLGFIFELVENSILVPIKFMGRKDSVENALMDILLAIAGGVCECFIFLLNLEACLILNAVLSIVLTDLYIKLKRKTLKE